MPRAVARACQFPGCNAHTRAKFCEKHTDKTLANHSRRRFDKTRARAWNRGYDTKHLLWREAILARDPLCKIAHFCGGLRYSTIADHIKPIAAGGERFDLGNGQGACKPCHDWKTATQDSKFLQGRGRRRE
jgi:5-methylcytosine-specific restriction protein A